MKKSCTFIKVRVRNGIKKSETIVTEFPSTDEPRQSYVDDFGRVISGNGVSKTHYVRTRQDRTRKDLSYQPSAGIHTMDPADIVEMMD